MSGLKSSVPREWFHGCATANMEVDMSRHIEFGKDLGLITEVVRRGLSVGIGSWEFWEWLSKPQPGLWAEMLQFLKFATPEYIGQKASWPKGALKRHCREPDLDTLDNVVREGRNNGFEKREWQRLVEDIDFFRTLVEYLHLAPPFSKTVEVDYDHIPPYVNGFDPGFPRTVKKGRAQCEMSIYVPAEQTSFLDTESLIHQQGWRFADQHELYAFGQGTKKHIRPWALIDKAPIYGPGSRRQGGDLYTFPRLWTFRGNYKLSHFGSCPNLGKGLEDDNLLIVKN